MALFFFASRVGASISTFRSPPWPSASPPPPPPPAATLRHCTPSPSFPSLPHPFAPLSTHYPSPRGIGRDNKTAKQRGALKTAAHKAAKKEISKAKKVAAEVLGMTKEEVAESKKLQRDAERKAAATDADAAPVAHHAVTETPARSGGAPPMKDAPAADAAPVPLPTVAEARYSLPPPPVRGQRCVNPPPPPPPLSFPT
jgi:hypothetical protein